jgi:hypothetical protein
VRNCGTILNAAGRKLTLNFLKRFYFPQKQAKNPVKSDKNDEWPDGCSSFCCFFSADVKKILQNAYYPVILWASENRCVR